MSSPQHIHMLFWFQDPSSVNKKWKQKFRKIFINKIINLHQTTCRRSKKMEPTFKKIISQNSMTKPKRIHQRQPQTISIREWEPDVRSQEVEWWMSGWWRRGWWWRNGDDDGRLINESLSEEKIKLMKVGWLIEKKCWW